MHCSGRRAACDAVEIFTEGREENQDLHFRVTQTLFISLVSFVVFPTVEAAPEAFRAATHCFAGDPPSLGFGVASTPTTTAVSSAESGWLRVTAAAPNIASKPFRLAVSIG